MDSRKVQILGRSTTSKIPRTGLSKSRDVCVCVWGGGGRYHSHTALPAPVNRPKEGTPTWPTGLDNIPHSLDQFRISKAGHTKDHHKIGINCLPAYTQCVRVGV